MGRSSKTKKFQGRKAFNPAARTRGQINASAPISLAVLDASAAATDESVKAAALWQSLRQAFESISDWDSPGIWLLKRMLAAIKPLEGNFEMIDFKNVRITAVNRDSEKDWAGKGRYLSIRAYTGNGDRLFMGPDIPISSELSNDDIERLTEAFLAAVCGK